MSDSYSGGNSYQIGEDDITAGVDAARNAIDDFEARRQEKLQKQAAVNTAEEQAVSEQADPRNAETWGAKALIKEGQSILSGGLQDTASSLATFPERTKDALSGCLLYTSPSPRD